MAVGRLKKDRVTTSGNTASRPSNPEIGDTFYNGELGQLEIYNGTSFIAVSAPPLAPTLATPTNASGSDAYSASGGKLSVVFTKNASGGEPIQYNAYTTVGGFSASSSSSTVTITGLTPGTSYVVYGNVSNNFGTSTNTANAAAATPSTRPEAPTIGTATAGDANATLTFTAGNTGGSSITNYKYSTDGTTYTAFSPAQTTSPLTISGLTNNAAVTFRLKAVNANGDSEASSQSNSVTPLPIFSVDFLVVAGGGGGAKGGGGGGGGGGAGGLRSTMNNTGGLGTLESTLSVAANNNYTVTVGGGGASGTSARGSVGDNSVFSTITATGGGGGGYSGTGSNSQSDGGEGGSGGGSGHYSTVVGTRTSSPVQGHNGGSSTGGAKNGGGGGGGAGALGSDAPTVEDGGNGGNGVSVSITGSAVTYGGGGGGASNTTGGSGGTGGGGAAGPETGTAGTANTGGGGGASYAGGTRTPAAGGSGVVILRWLTSSGSITVGAGLTADSTGTDGSYSYKKFTAGSGNVSWS